MKITGPSATTPLRSVDPVKRGREDRGAPSAEAGATKVALSSDASFVQSLRDEAAPFGEPRADVVASARAEIANGTFGQGIDRDAMLNSLLADL